MSAAQPPTRTEQPVWLMSLSMAPVVLDAGKTASIDQLTWRSERSALWALVLFNDEAEIALGEYVAEVRPATVAIFPPGPPVATLRFKGSWEVHFAMFGVQAGLGNEVPVPYLTDFASQASQIRARFETIAAFDADPQRSAQEVYALVQEIASRSKTTISSPPLHPGLEAAVAFIEANLGERIAVKTIAEHARLSQRQLFTHFRRSYGTTVAGYIRQRRTERAWRLLTTTDLPAKTIAHQIGAYDLQHFNKLMRHAYGMSPRAIRGSARTRLLSPRP